MIRFRVPGDNKAIVSIGERTYYFSYETCIAMEIGAARVRRNRNYSRTTAKHMTQLGVKDWPQVDDAAFEKLAAFDIIG